MRYYTVHLPENLSQGGPAAGDREDNAGQMLGAALLLREGFNWTAMVFSIAWAIGHGLWLGALALAAGLALIVGLPEIFALDWTNRTVLLIGFLLFCGFNGNDWLRAGLKESGWNMICVVAARDRDHAMQRFAHQLDRTADGPINANGASTAPADAVAADTVRPTAAAPHLDIGPSPGFWS
jgi:hypothetical protein